MCDVYGHKCLLCDEIVPMHLGDFETGRGEIDVICWNHTFAELQPHLKNSVLWFMDIHPPGHLWSWEEEDGGWNWQRAAAEAEEMGGGCVLIRALTANARNHWKQNYPNTFLTAVPVQGSWFVTKEEIE